MGHNFSCSAEFWEKVLVLWKGGVLVWKSSCACVCEQEEPGKASCCERNLLFPPVRLGENFTCPKTTERRFPGEIIPFFCLIQQDLALFQQFSITSFGSKYYFFWFIFIRFIMLSKWTVISPDQVNPDPTPTQLTQNFPSCDTCGDAVDSAVSCSNNVSN